MPLLEHPSLKLPILWRDRLCDDANGFAKIEREKETKKLANKLSSNPWVTVSRQMISLQGGIEIFMC
jgi:hypothetical protein